MADIVGQLAGVWRSYGPSAWNPEWVQAILALFALPLTWAVATWSSRQNFRIALANDGMERKRDRDLKAEETRRKLVARQKYLATQILYCAIRLKWSGEELKASEGGSTQPVASMFRHLDHYSATISVLNTHEHELDPSGGMLTARLDDIMSFLARLRLELATILTNTTYSQLVSRVDGWPLYVYIGDFAIGASKVVFDLLGSTLDLLEDEVEDWIEAHRGDLEEALRDVDEPPLPAPLQAVINRAQAGDRKIVIPEPPATTFMQGRPIP